MTKESTDAALTGTIGHASSHAHAAIHFQNMILAITVSCLTGCSTYWRPTVGMLAPPKEVPQHAIDNMPGLSAVVNETNTKITTLADKRDSSLTTNRILGVSTFGLGLAAAGYGLYGGHANAMKNLAFASGGAYVGSSLFTPLAQTEIYHSGIQALSCINDKAARTLYQIDEDIETLKKTPPLDSSAFSCTLSGNGIIEQKNAYNKAKSAEMLATSKDYSLAQTARSASNNVLMELDKQLIALTPNPDAILNAAKSILPSGGISSVGISSGEVSLAGISTDKQLLLKRRKEKRSCKEQEQASADTRLNERTANYQTIEKSLIEALNYMDGLSSACVLDEKPVTPVTLSQDEVTVTKDIKYVNVVISGGREPYLITHSDIPGLIVNFIQPRTINIISTTGLQAGDHKVEIRDNSTVTTPRILTIKVPK